MRVRYQATSWYLVGDASQSWFGTSLFTKSYFVFESGDWASYEQEKTSNWHEAGKSTFRLEQGVI